MPTITYPGPDQISPAIDLGQGRSLALPTGQPVEITEEVAAKARQQYPAGEFIIDPPTAAAPAPAKKK